MPENGQYPGSSSLSPEAREKVLQIFNHTLGLAREGRNDEALLGCDFILKLDGRFAPGRLLLDSLRGAAGGTVVDLSFFEMPAPVADPKPKPIALPAAPEATPEPPVMSFDSAPLPPVSSSFGEFPDLTPPSAVFAPRQSPAPAPSPASLDSLGFDTFGSADPFAAPSAPPSATPDLFDAPRVDLFLTPPSIGRLPESPAPFASELSSFDHPSFDPASSPPPSVSAPALPDFDSLGDPFALPPPVPEAPSGLNDFGFATPHSGFPVTQAPAKPSPPASPGPLPPPRPPVAAPAPAATTDPRVLQFLKQGDEAITQGRIQEAIDLWSRVFLIDLSNVDASSRIDAAREKQAQTAQTIDVLLSEGIQLFDTRDFISARSKFLDVLALSENESTARNYLNQIESALSESDSASTSFGGTGSDFLSDSPSDRSSEAGGQPFLGTESLLVSGNEPSQPLESDELASTESPRATSGGRKTLRVDLRLVGAGVLALAALAGGGYYFFGSKKPAPPAPLPPKAAAPAPKPVGEDLIGKAQALFSQGRADEALQILVSIPDSDPRHREALGLIDRFKSSAVPSSAGTMPLAASLDDMRAAGFAAMSANKYIEAVKAFDPVVKARPDDVEAAQALTKARENLSSLASAVRAYNEQDYESAVKLLWDLRKKDMKNQDVEEFLFKSYFNGGVQDLQAGNAKKAALSFQEAANLRPQDTETARHLRFSRKYSSGTTDILSRIYVKNATPRP